jgi:hypothetical protein
MIFRGEGGENLVIAKVNDQNFRSFRWPAPAKPPSSAFYDGLAEGAEERGLRLRLRTRLRLRGFAASWSWSLSWSLS